MEEPRNGDKKMQRKSNIELLRIIAMLLIISCHLFMLAGVRQSNYADGINSNEIISQLFGCGGKFGNELFILIAGYFSISSKFKPTKILQLIRETQFYSWGILIFVALFTNIPLSVMKVMKSLFPVLLTQYWFITTFICLMVLMPFINKFVGLLNAKQYLLLLIAVAIPSTIIPTLSLNMNPSVGVFDMGVFLLLYLVGGFIKKYESQTKSRMNACSRLALALVPNVLLLSTVLAFDKIGKFDNALFFDSQESFLLFLGALGIFYLFVNMDIGCIKIINTIASSVFAVYLLHENPFLHQYLWTDILKFQNNLNQSTINFVLIGMLIVLTTFAICTIIDKIRETLFSIKFINAIFKGIDEAIIKRVDVFIAK
jgi:ABC-type multidrug transport system fused ATPase/permease subunit